MITPMQEARDRRRMETYNPVVFEIFIFAIGGIIFSVSLLYILPNDTPVFVTLPILFFGMAMFGISIIAVLYMAYIQFCNWLFNKSKVTE